MDYFDWVIDVDQASLQGTTPAFLLSELTTEDSATAFYQMTVGHARKINKYESVVESAFDTALPGTGSFFAIVRQVIYFGQNTSDSFFAIIRSATTAELGSSFLDWLRLLHVD